MCSCATLAGRIDVWYGYDDFTRHARFTAAAMATMVGTETDDLLNGTAGPDVTVGLGGNDVLLGLDGDDDVISQDGPTTG
ncbi:hypothetical protein [Micromonospora carbonacea]|uniref:hypothetical protein n=1 Tax=Micromonospora carbonacea TaxID=47853 RepID=UPI00371156A7